MKTFTQFNEQQCLTSDINPGNSMKIMNHLTPINNIVTNIRNLFSTLPIVVCVGEDGISLKIHSSKFVCPNCVNDILNACVGRTSLINYIVQQGLNKSKMLNVGQYYVVYFYADDIAQSNENPNPECGCSAPEVCDKCAPCTEQFEDETELYSIISESDDDEEIQDLTRKKIKEIINLKDKVKAAKQFEMIVSQEIELPREYYFAGVKSKFGEESIALRWKYSKKRPHNRTEEVTRSLINIFGDGKEAVWVGDFDEKSLFNLPDEVKKLIENIIEIIGAEKTNNPCIFSIEEKDDDKSDDKKDEDKKDDEKSDDKKDEDKKDDEKSDDKGSEKVDDLL